MAVDTLEQLQQYNQRFNPFTGIGTGLSHHYFLKHVHGNLNYNVWPENLPGIKFGGLALQSCELHLTD